MRTAYDLRNKEKMMKRKFWPAAMTALMALLLTCGFAACADTGDTGNDNPNDNPDTPEEPLQATEGLVFTLSQDGTEYFVTDYTGTAAEVYVPATHEGLPVTTIRHYGDGDAFAYCKQLTSVTLPDSITSIGGGAFLACSQLTSVTLPDSLVSIGEDAFAHCENLASVTLPESLVSIGNAAFQSCTTLTNIHIPAGIMYIGEAVFELCNDLESITVAENNAFYAARDGILYNKDMTQFIHAPAAIEGSVTVPGSITSIGTDVFSRCIRLQSLTIEEGVERIESQAFWLNSGLTSVTIPDSVWFIGSDAFANCENLAEITINGSVEYMAAGAFFNTAYYNDADNWENGVLYIGSHLIEAQDTLSGAYSVKQGTTVIAYNAFENSAITGITLPDSVTHIGDRAFYACYNLQRAALGNGVVSIGAWAFNECSNLQSITVGNTVTSIGIFAFRNTAFFNDDANWEDGILFLGNYLIAARETLSGAYTVRQGTTIIADAAFADCINLTSVTIPEGVTHIGANAFANCFALASVDIPDSVTGIGDSAFSSCSSLTSITIPEGVTRIGDWTFVGCGNLESVVLPDSVTSIGYEAFMGCGSLTSIVLPANLTSIEISAFSGCYSLTSITIPESVVSIEDGAFSGCTELTSVTFENPEGWYVSEDAEAGTRIESDDLSDPATAARYLTDMYYYCYHNWIRLS